MNTYTFTIRHSTVIFQFTVYAATQRSANRQAMRRISLDYPNFSIYKCTTI